MNSTTFAQIVKLGGGLKKKGKKKKGKPGKVSLIGFFVVLGILQVRAHPFREFSSPGGILQARSAFEFGSPGGILQVLFSWECITSSNTSV